MLITHDSVLMKRNTRSKNNTVDLGTKEVDSGKQLYTVQAAESK